MVPKGATRILYGGEALDVRQIQHYFLPQTVPYTKSPLPDYLGTQSSRSRTNGHTDKVPPTSILLTSPTHEVHVGTVQYVYHVGIACMYLP